MQTKIVVSDYVHFIRVRMKNLVINEKKDFLQKTKVGRLFNDYRQSDCISSHQYYLFYHLIYKSNEVRKKCESRKIFSAVCITVMFDQTGSRKAEIITSPLRCN